jgi:outer membrane protein OmpA-like peptidoglycan-associated protein/Tol biopolymer transport system component
MNFSASRRPLLVGVVLAAIALASFIEPGSALKKLAKGLRHAAMSPRTMVSPEVLSKPLPPPPPPAPVPDTNTNQFRTLVVKNLGPIINSGYEDFGPTITADGRTLYYVSRRPGKGYDDFLSTTNPNGDDTTWTDPINQEAINSPFGDGAASIAADGQTIYFATNRGSSENANNDMNIWVATLEGHDWRNMHEIGAPINTTSWESQPAISPDGKKLFFASNRSGKMGNENKTNVDIFISHLLPDGRWSEPVNLGPTINTKGYDGSPFMSADGQTLYFCSDGHGGVGKRDIFMSEFRGPSDQDWSTPIALPEPINSSADDMFLTIPASGKVLFFSSNRSGGSGALDVYEAFNPPKPKPTLVLRGTCYDVNTNEKLAAHVVIVEEQTGDTVYNKNANSETGEYLCVLSPNKNGFIGGTYIISATEPNHFPYPATPEVIPLRNDSDRVITHDIPMNNETPPIVKWVTETPGLFGELKPLPAKFDNFHGLVVREKLTIELYALLPMIFYDEGSSDFRPRYILFSSKDQTNGFREDTLTATLNAYYNYLNCLGFRLRNKPEAKITLVGCNSQQSPAEKSLDLSKTRAENVKKYLVDIWSIDPARIAVESRGLPQVAAMSTTPEGIEENRRVEIKSDDWDIIKPVRQERLVKYPDFRTAKFSMNNGIKDSRVKKRWLVITHGGQVWAKIDELGNVSETMSPEWGWRSDAGNMLPPDEEKLGVQMFVIDLNDKEHSSAIDYTSVAQFSQKDVAAVHMADRTREIYNLILFDFASANGGKWNQKILEEFVFNRIQPTSDVVIAGYTDILGTPDYNMTLSANRAKWTQNAIKAKIGGKVHTMEAKGYGKTAPLFPNETPEGRNYNRTVQVVIETPIENK